MMDTLWDTDGTVSLARGQAELARLMQDQYRAAGTAHHRDLTDAEVARIAVAVCDEMERRASHPLRVTEHDRRHWTEHPFVVALRRRLT